MNTPVDYTQYPSSMLSVSRPGLDVVHEKQLVHVTHRGWEAGMLMLRVETPHMPIHWIKAQDTYMDCLALMMLPWVRPDFEIPGVKYLAAVKIWKLVNTPLQSVYIVADCGRINLENPGDDTPEMVYLVEPVYGSAILKGSATFSSFLDNGEMDLRGGHTKTYSDKVVNRAWKLEPEVRAWLWGG